MHGHTRLTMSNLWCKIILMYALDLCIIVGGYTLAFQEHTHTYQTWTACILVCMQIVSQGQWYLVSEHIHVLKCDSFCDKRCKPKDFI